jgi:hypothetical protein
MKPYRSTVASRLCAAGMVSALAGGVLLSAQQLPIEPAKKFGASITPAYEGWFDNPDGTHSFLVGYMNRNRAQDEDVPIGPNNQIEPGGPDRGQPTHFLPGRQTGMFAITVPKEFTPQQRLTWTITLNGQTNSIPFHLQPDYNISPFTEIAVHNTPPVIRFEETGQTVQGPLASALKPLATRSASVSAPLPLTVWAEDDAKYTSGSATPLRNPPPPPVTLSWSKYRGPGAVTFDKAKPALDNLAGGLVNQLYKGKATTTAKFSEAGDYVLHATANDYSGVGGGGFQCCWTTAVMKVSVAP